MMQMKNIEVAEIEAAVRGSVHGTQRQDTFFRFDA